MEQKWKLLKQGAEAKLFVGSFYDRPTIIKERFKKGYRHPDLDQSLTKQRVKAELRALLRCRQNGIKVPAVYFVDLLKNSIYMEYFTPSITTRDFINEQLAHNKDNETSPLLENLMKKIGATVGKMHSKNIIHGDLTTSNMLLLHPLENIHLVLIDFGLSYVDNLVEDKAVDLYVLERAFLSTHPNTEPLFKVIIKSYCQAYGKGYSDVIKKLDEVRLRGRKRTMVG